MSIVAQLHLCRDEQQVICSYKLEAERTTGKTAWPSSESPGIWKGLWMLSEQDNFLSIA